MSDLHDVIEQAIDDVDLPLEEPDLDTAASDDSPSEVVEPTTTATDLDTTTADTTTEESKVEEPVDSFEVKSPAAKGADTTPKDDFEKRFGIPQNSSSGRENRIPYSRVKKITEKAIKEEAARVSGEYTPKIQEFETQLRGYQEKVTDYEGRLLKVAEFENIMVNDVPRFLGMLAGMPQYSQFLAPLFQNHQEAPSQAPQATTQAPPGDDMPQPDQELSDGSKVYSMEGLTKLNAWNRAQARKEALADVDKDYGEIKREWQAYRRIQEVMPKVQAQIADARKWPQFNENEQDIVKALQQDQTLSLEGAYNRVVVPKIVAAKGQAEEAAKAQVTDTDKLRAEIRAQLLKELKAAPRATSAASGGVKPAPASTRTGPRSLESVIEEAMQSLK